MYKNRIATIPKQSFFLFGPRGTGKSTWLRHRLPEATVVDLLRPEVHRELSARPERLRERVLGAGEGSTIVVDEVQRIPELLTRAEVAGGGAELIRVIDDGEGIAAEHIPRLTERFYRVDVARSRATGGSGLGLAIVKHAMQQNQGKLRIESELGRGSTFICDFPTQLVVYKGPETSRNIGSA